MGVKCSTKRRWTGDRQAILRGGLTLVLSCAAVAFFGCTEDELFGPGISSTADASTPAGVQSGEITIVYSLKSRSTTSVDIDVTYSADGRAFVPATEGSGGDGTIGLSVTEPGASHTFVWDSFADIPSGRFSDVQVRVSPVDGRRATTNSFTVNNTVFLAAAVEGAGGAAIVDLYELDLVDASLHFVEAVDSGGDGAAAVVERRGKLFLAQPDTDSVVAFRVDQGFVELDGPPIATGGDEPSYLAVDADFLYASNVGDGTVSVFHVEGADDEPIRLTLDDDAPIAVSGCRGLVSRGDWLYVASETDATIRVFDTLGSDGLREVDASPIAATGLDTPRAVAAIGSHLVVSNASTASVVVFRFTGEGDLVPVTGSPFTMSHGGLESIARSGTTRAYFAGGTGADLLVADIDGNGVLSEITASPYALAGDSFAVVALGDLVVGSSIGDGGTLEPFLEEDDGTLTRATEEPASAEGPVRGMAISE